MSRRKVAARLRDVLAAVPGFRASGSSSASLAGLLSFAKDAETAMSHARVVLTWIACPPPHPEYGDDGYSEAMAEDGEQALRRLEAWVAWRNGQGWSAEGAVRLTPLDDVPWGDHRV